MRVVPFQSQTQSFAPTYTHQVRFVLVNRDLVSFCKEYQFALSPRFRVQFSRAIPSFVTLLLQLFQNQQGQVFHALIYFFLYKGLLAIP